MLFTIIIFIEALCFSSALFFLRKKNTGWWQNFIWFLLLTVCVETGGYILYFIEGIQNHWLFNLYLPTEIGFLFFLLYKICKQYISVGLLLLGAFAVFFTLYLFESFHTKWKEYSVNANTFASVVIILVAFLFYYFLLRQDGYVEITKYPSFWIVTGLFAFYLGSIGCSLFAAQLTDVYKKTGVPIRFIIMLVLNFILYGCWSYAFLCKNRQKISFSS